MSQQGRPLGVEHTYDATVVRWVDGDTVWLRIDVGFRMTTENNFRLYGIDTPERGQRNHDKATAYAAQLAPAGTAVVARTYQADKYGRWLAEIQVPGADLTVNQQLLDAHLAKPYYGGTKS